MELLGIIVPDWPAFVSLVMPFLWSNGLFRLVNASLLRMAGSIVSKGSSGMVVSLIGILYPARSRKLEQESDGMLFGEQGGESPDWSFSWSSGLGDGSSKIVEKGDEKLRNIFVAGV